MEKIVKVIYEDGSEIELGVVVPLEKTKLGSDNGESWRAAKKYKQQFENFEHKILKSIDSDTIKEYAIDNFDLVDEDKIEEKTLEDFDDDELMDEVAERGLVDKSGSTIITEDFVERFISIIEKENPTVIDALLTAFEYKYGL